ncbi:4'-phosphopantetheinyl transferase family protein [Undibacterium sp. Di27W]|uniref:4'-phosphopantetheinyl transferase family protein n=1 Tax=Undibacterium sp. Di27W TaxID=3413036 RepID=UPI003BF60CC2
MEDICLERNEILVVLAKRQLAERMALQLLDEAEVTRYHAYVFEADKQRHLLAHGLKRQVLARLTGQAPESLQFRAGPAGKPYLPDQKVQFNISHSGDWVALAFSTTHVVGVDVEQARDLDYDDLLTQIAHPADALTIFNTNSKSSEQRFLASWSMKEAVAKCAGKGLSMHFPSLRLTADEHGRHVCISQEDSWHVRHQMLGSTHLAVASSSANWHLRLLELE